jgi:hypothetical protein
MVTCSVCPALISLSGFKLEALQLEEGMVRVTCAPFLRDAAAV